MKLPDPSRERPTIGTLATAFTTAMLTWLAGLVPDTVPPEVATTGYALAVALVAVAIGKAAQGQILSRWLGAKAPWSSDTHQAAVAYALSLDPDVHGDERDLVLSKLGVDGEAEALRLIGLDSDKV